MQEFNITINGIPMHLSYDATTTDKAYNTQLARIQKYMQSQAVKRLVGRPVGSTAFETNEIEAARALLRSDAVDNTMPKTLAKSLAISMYRAKKLLEHVAKQD